QALEGMLVSLYFFLQEEDGIRVFHVTGVQTCALPILVRWPIASGDGCAEPRPADVGDGSGPPSFGVPGPRGGPSVPRGQRLRQPRGIRLPCGPRPAPRSVLGLRGWTWYSAA